MKSEYDVIVCGAGPAGIGAAVAAGRAGARVLLIERLFHVGGIGTSTSVHTWCDTPGGRVFDELEAGVAALGKARRRFDPQMHTCRLGRVTLHGETVKTVALRMVRKASVDILFGATVVDACFEKGTLRGVRVAGIDGLREIAAPVVIDATADADVAAFAGARCLKGDPDDGRLMHVNFRVSLGEVDVERYQREKPSDEALVALIRAARRRGELHVPRGIFRPDRETFPFHKASRSLVLTNWEIEGVDCSDPVAVSATIADCQWAILDVVEFCRKHLPGYEHCEIARIWDVLGTRESRRIVGRYTLTRDDVLSGRKFDDGIARACFFIDFHDSPPGHTLPYDMAFKRQNSPPEGDCYEIPYRCLVPESVGGLLVTGRCISADRSALASLRVMPTCMYLGEAAGTAAALAVARGIPPGDVDGKELKQRLIS
jgi:hypothetical protein